MGEPAVFEAIPKKPGAGNDKADNLKLLDAFLRDTRSPMGSFGSFGAVKDAPNLKEFTDTQRFVSGNPAAAAGIMQMNMMPVFEKGSVQKSLTDHYDELWALECSGNKKGDRATLMIPRRMSTIECHKQQPTFEPPPPPKPFTVGDLRSPAATKEIADAMSARAIAFGDECLSPADKAAFKTAITDINKRADISASDRTNILGSLCVMMWPGTNRPFNDETCRKMALALANTIAHPPEGATGDLKLAQSDPRRLSEYVRNMTVRGVANYGDNEQRQLTEDGKKTVREAKTPQEALDKLLGATRSVIPTNIDIDLRKLDDPKEPNPANFTMSDEVKKVLKAIHEADKRIQTINISHNANGDDIVRIGLEAGRTEGEGLKAITFGKSLSMTVHRNGDGTVELKDLKGISTPLLDPDGIKLGKAGDPNRKIIAVTWLKNRDITNEIAGSQIEQFDQMIRVLDDVNAQRKR